LGYVRLFEKRGPVTLRVDQIVELLNLITEFDGQSVVLKLTSVSDGFHSRFLIRLAE
jgi:hypothetical protein